jgi:hypothetical protein
VLTNPISIEIRIGPICRAARKIIDIQEVLEFMHAQYKLITHNEIDGNYIYIKDVGNWGQCRTITNDADYIVKKLYEEHGITDDTRIFYKDSEGQVDELIHQGKIFTGFKYGHEGVELLKAT